MQFIEEIGFSHIHIFTYSSRNGTKAATLPGHISPAIKKARSKQLHDLANAMREAYLKSLINQDYAVLWETRNQSNHWMGYTDNFVRVALNANSDLDLENKISNIKVLGIAQDAGHCTVALI